MDQFQLKTHLDKFDSRKGKFLLEVECEKTFCGIHPENRDLAFMLCDTAAKSGATKYIRLFYFPDPDTEIVLYDSDQMENRPCLVG